MLRVHGWKYPKPVTKAEGPAEEFFSEVPRVGGLGTREDVSRSMGHLTPFLPAALPSAEMCHLGGVWQH